MNIIDNITSKVSAIRPFTDESYLKTTYLVVFLLFGSSDEIKELFEKRAHEIIVDKKAIVFLSIDNANDAVAHVRAAVDAVRKSGADIDDLKRLHFCPVIIGEKSDSDVFFESVENLENYRKDKALKIVWKPFLILDAECKTAGKWLETITTIIKKITDEGGSSCCRCCVMTYEDEKGFEVSYSRLLNIVLFTALLYANNNTQEGIGRLIAYIKSSPNEFFYTAQTVFVSNPVIMRTLRCMYLLLEKLDTQENHETDMDLRFINNILSSIYAKLPHNSYGQITFAPLYGVMPNLDNNPHRFFTRLENFAAKHYLSQFRYNKSEIFGKFKKHFLLEFIRSGKPLEFLQSIIGNTNAIKNISRISSPVQIAAYPPPASKMTSESASVYAEIEKRLRIKLTSIGSELLEEFLNSKEFESLPRLYSEARVLIRDIIKILKDEVSRRINLSGEEILLELDGDPDEKIIADASRDLINNLYFPRTISKIALAMEKDDSEINEIRQALIDTLFEYVRGLAGGSGAKEYMNLVSLTCQNPYTDSAKHCIEKIASKSRFPISFTNRGHRKRTFVWGNEENHFFNALERHQALFETDTEFLNITSKERFVLLTVSPAFTRADIKGIPGLEV